MLLFEVVGLNALFRKRVARIQPTSLKKYFADQYLQDAPLVTPIGIDSNEWHRLVNATPCLAHNPLILHPRPKESLRQLFDGVRRTMGSLINCSQVPFLNESFRVMTIVSVTIKTRFYRAIASHALLRQ